MVEIGILVEIRSLMGHINGLFVFNPLRERISVPFIEKHLLSPG